VRRLRRLANTVPVLMLTAKGQIEDRLPAWTPARMIISSNPSARGTACPGCGRCCGGFSGRPKRWKIALGEIEIDLARQTAVRGKKQIHLTAKEFPCCG